jgi:hypothetical protein
VKQSPVKCAIPPSEVCAVATHSMHIKKPQLGQTGWGTACRGSDTAVHHLSDRSCHRPQRFFGSELTSIGCLIGLVGLTGNPPIECCGLRKVAVLRQSKFCSLSVDNLRDMFAARAMAGCPRSPSAFECWGSFCPFAQDASKTTNRKHNLRQAIKSYDRSLCKIASAD